MQTLQRFRDTIPPAQLVSRRLPHTFHKAAEEVEEGIDELGELTKLYHLHMERVNIDLTHERTLKKLMPTMTQEIRVARELLGAIADLKMDLGLNTRHIGQVDVEARIEAEIKGKYGKDSVKKVMESPESRRKVLNIAERILALPGRTEKAEREQPGAVAAAAAAAAATAAVEAVAEAIKPLVSEDELSEEELALLAEEDPAVEEEEVAEDDGAVE